MECERVGGLEHTARQIQDIVLPTRHLTHWSGKKWRPLQKTSTLANGKKCRQLDTPQERARVQEGGIQVSSKNVRQECRLSGWQGAAEWVVRHQDPGYFLGSATIAKILATQRSTAESQKERAAARSWRLGSVCGRRSLGICCESLTGEHPPGGTPTWLRSQAAIRGSIRSARAQLGRARGALPRRPRARRARAVFRSACSGAEVQRHDYGYRAGR